MFYREQPINEGAAILAQAYEFHTEWLSKEAEEILGTFPMPHRPIIAISDPVKIFRRLRYLSKPVEALKVTDPELQDDCDSIKQVWAENQSKVKTLVENAVAEQVSLEIAEQLSREEELTFPVAAEVKTSDTTKLLTLYGQQLDLVEELLETIGYEHFIEDLIASGEDEPEAV
jgi:hypothetical protein